MMPDIRAVLLAIGDSPAASMVAKATVIAVLALAGAALARGSRAAVRHALLAVAFGALAALPLASLAAPPIRIALRMVEQAAPPLHAQAAGPVVSIARESPAVAAASSPSWRPRPADLLLGAWVAGVALFLLPVFVGLRQVRRLRRTGLPWRDGRSMAEGLASDAGLHRRVEILLHEALPGPITCGILRPAILLPVDARDWKEEDLNRAMVHEFEHLRRGDWAFHCLARVVCAAYWFHPLVWVAWRQLALEAERACDDAVLARSEATAYADQLVRVAERLLAAARRPMLAMAGRADLVTRVGAVLDSRQPRGRAGALPVTLACAGAVALVLTVAPLHVVAATEATVTNVTASAPSLPPPRTVVTKTPSVKPVPRPAAVLMAAAPQAAAPAQSADTPRPRYFAGAQLVVVDVTASYPNGGSIEGLTPGDFVLTEDGAPQRIAVFEYQKVDAVTAGAGRPISSYYVLGYYPSSTDAGAPFRKLGVTLKGVPTAKLEFRDGYYTATAATGEAEGPPGPGVAFPQLLRKIEPEYSEGARKARFQGTVVLLITVNADGSVGDAQLRRTLGLGLDEKAVEAVKQWKFIPGKKDLVAVPMQADVLVSFRLL